jgi:hypothetical protein
MEHIWPMTGLWPTIVERNCGENPDILIFLQFPNLQVIITYCEKKTQAPNYMYICHIILRYASREK